MRPPFRKLIYSLPPSRSRRRAKCNVKCMFVYKRLRETHDKVGFTHLLRKKFVPLGRQQRSLDHVGARMMLSAILPSMIVSSAICCCCCCCHRHRPEIRLSSTFLQSCKSHSFPSPWREGETSSLLLSPSVRSLILLWTTNSEMSVCLSVGVAYSFVPFGAVTLSPVGWSVVGWLPGGHTHSGE